MKRIVMVPFVVLACFMVLASQNEITPILAQRITDDSKPDGYSDFQRDVLRELKGTVVTEDAKAVMNVSELAKRQAEIPTDFTPGTIVPPNQIIVEEDLMRRNAALRTTGDQARSSELEPWDKISSPLVSSPSPSASFLGHDDVPQVGTGNIVIPPDTMGAVGLSDVVVSLNNNFVVQSKITGAQTLAISQVTFWSGVGASGPFDPRILFDPYNSRWIVAAVTSPLSPNSAILIGVSQTSNPAGSYYQFRVDVDATNTHWADFPTIGFNKNWVSINVNMIQFAAGAPVPNLDLVIDYPSLRTGVFHGTFFPGTDAVTAPATTYSATENVLYQVVHLSSVDALYAVDTITGTADAPVYTLGSAKVRNGGGWTPPPDGGQILPQANPLAGTSSCGVATPCKLETQDSTVRTNPVFRNGNIYYAQTIGLPSGGTLTHTAVQWTMLAATTGDFADGGRVDDPTASDANGGKWYAYPSIAVNASNDVIMGFTQFASNQFPSAGYTLRFHLDALGTMRDPFIYKAGEDYYHKDFGGGRNRFGDYSATQVDPSNDQDLWTLQEYAKARVGTNDGTSGSNSSRWSTWWAKVAIAPTSSALTLGGRIRTASGRLLPRAFVSLADQNGQVRVALGSAVGTYRFLEVESGLTYILSVRAKGYEFTPQAIFVTQENLSVDFIAQ